MPFDWAEYLNLAEELAQRSEEAAMRSAVSRAYYAALCLARNHLNQKGEQIPLSENTHKAVWDAFQKKGRTYASVYQNGVRLRNKRRQADYDDEISNLPSLVTDAIKTAKSILHWLEKASGPSSSN